MAWIRTLDPEAPPEATSSPHLARALSLDPAAMHFTMHTHWQLLEGPSPLTRLEREMIATVVAATQRCLYLAAAHSEALRDVSGDDALADTLKINYKDAALSAREWVLLDYVYKMVTRPNEMQMEDIEDLREAGFDDPAVLQVVLLVSWISHVGRIAEALGLEVEPNVWEKVSRHAPISWETESASTRPLV